MIHTYIHTYKWFKWFITRTWLVKGFGRGKGSNFPFPHWFTSSPLQHSRTTARVFETQLSQTNRATHLCKCNDVADLTSIIKIRLTKIWFLTSGLSRSLKVIGTYADRSAIHDFLLVFYSNFVPKTHTVFWDIRLQKCCDLNIRVRGPSRSFDMSPLYRAHVMFYSNHGSISCRFWDIQCRTNVVTLKSESEVTEVHWKWYHSIDWVWFPINVL